MKTLTVTLKQHTPLIHFQHNQYGATLRASEVKPKLDRFLLSKLESEKKKGWLMKRCDDSPALDYKIRINSCEIEDEYLVASYLKADEKNDLGGRNICFIDASPYFAQEKQNKTLIRNKNASLDSLTCTGVMLKNKSKDSGKSSAPPQNDAFVIVTISSFKKDLVDWIAEPEQIQTFFLIENFGSRQNKGFGCFEVKSIKLSGNENKVELKPNEEILKSNFKFCYKKIIENSSLRNIFRTIADDYKLLKSGRNRTIGNKSIYEKSKLMLWGSDKKLRWEKKFFKDKINQADISYRLKSFHKKEDYLPIKEGESYVYLRALLGVANQNEFLLENPPASGKKLVVSFKGVDGVERFQSPILFKVIDRNIYMLANDIPNYILNRKFRFQITVQGDPNVNMLIEERLNTPEHFNLVAFMSKYANELGYIKIE